MMSAPTIMKVRCCTVSAPMSQSDGRQDGAQDDRQDPDEGSAEIAADQAAEPADDRHEQDLEGEPYREGGRLGRAQPEEHHHRSGKTANIGRHGEGRELCRERPDADQLRRDVHVAGHHPRPADMAAQDVLHEQRHDDGDGEHDEIARRRRGSRSGNDHAEGFSRRHLDGARGVVIVEPGDADEAPLEEELRGERRHREIEALDAERRKAEDDADSRREEPRYENEEQKVRIGEDGRELVAGIGADPHERACPERKLTGIAGEEVEPDRRHREDQERDHDRVEEEVAPPEAGSPRRRRRE